MKKILKLQELEELSQGDWEGQSREEIYTPEQARIINSNNWEFRPSNGESQKDVEIRMTRWVEKNLLRNYEANKVVALCGSDLAHKCFLRGVMDFYPSLTYKLILDNTSISRLKYDELGWHVATINDASHLPQKQRIDRFKTNG